MDAPHLPQDEEPDAAWSPADRGWVLVLDFRRVDVEKIDAAIALHARQPGAVRMLDERGTCIYRNIYRPPDLALFRDLWRLASEWPGTQAYLSGQPTDRDEIDAFIDRYVDHVLSEGREERSCADHGDYPAHLGCRDHHIRLRLGPELRDSRRPYWFDFARPLSRGEWLLDRHRMQAFLSPLRQRNGCPALSFPRIGAAIDRLPERLDVTGIWRYEPNPLGYPATRRLVPRHSDRYHAYLAKLFRESEEWRPNPRGVARRENSE